MKQNTNIARRMDPRLADSASGKNVLKVLGLWAALSVAAGSLTALGASVFHLRDGDLQTLLIVAEVYVLMPISMLLVYRGWSRLRRVVQFRFTSWRDIGLAVGMYIATLAGVFLAYVLLSPVLGSARDSAEFLFENATFISRLPHASAWTVALILLQTTFLAALAEELFFRGLLFKWLRPRYSAVRTILMISVIFGLQHFVGPGVAIAGFLWGLGAGILREKTGSTLNVIVMHILGDCTLLAGAYIMVR